MKYTGIYLIGFFILVGGILGALWKTGVLASIGAEWTVIGVVIAFGVGIMLAVANSATNRAIQIGEK